MKGTWASLVIGMAALSLPADAELTTPIYHELYYQGEAELDGYAPGFVPNVVSFDLDNRPWIRDGLRVQRFNPASGDWDSLDLVPSILAAYPSWTGLDDFGSRSRHQIDTRVVFDSGGDAYTFVASRGWTGIPVALLLHSRDDGLSWDVHPLPIAYRYARLEFSDAGLPLERPPAIVLTDDGQPLKMLTPEKKPDGTLEMGSSVYLDANDPRLPPGGDGHSNFSLTRDGQTYVAYMSVSGFDGDGTPTWITRYDRDTGVLDPPVYLGDAGTGAPDNHNTPALTIDSQGTLHVVFGAHHQSFLYTRSLAPYSITGGWTAPVQIGADIDALPAGADPACTGFCHQYTYVSLVRDQNDTLHMVSRWAGTAGRTYFFRLSYLRKPSSQGWSIREDLVVPFKAYYSNWYQKLSLDRSGRLFLFYIYYGNQLFSDEAAAYNGFWPEDGIEPEVGCTTTPREPGGNYCWFNNVEPHGPVLLRSEDAGSTWHTTTTTDFQVAQLPALRPWGVGVLMALFSLLGVWGSRRFVTL